MGTRMPRGFSWVARGAQAGRRLLMRPQNSCFAEGFPHAETVGELGVGARVAHAVWHAASRRRKGRSGAPTRRRSRVVCLAARRAMTRMRCATRPRRLRRERIHLRSRGSTRLTAWRTPPSGITRRASRARPKPADGSLRSPNRSRRRSPSGSSRRV